MAFFDGVKKFFGGEPVGDTEMDNGEDEYYNVPKKEEREETSGTSKMVLQEPRAYSESTQIVDYLKKRSTVVVNLKRVTPDQGKRIVDFLYGSVYAMNGSLQKLGGGIFLCTPNNVDVVGEITEDRKTSVGGKGKPKEEEEDEYNGW